VPGGVSGVGRITRRAILTKKNWIQVHA